MTNVAGDDIPTVSEKFDKQLIIFYKIDKSLLNSTSNDFQIQVSDCIKELEKLTTFISHLGLFSGNEKQEELSTNSLKFVLLPALLGLLTLKQIDPPREDVLRIASIYFKDFIYRCREYEITNVEIPHEDKENVDKSIESKSYSNSSIRNKPTPEELKIMGQRREEKIKRFKEKKLLNEKIEQMKVVLDKPSTDEDILRDYHLTTIKHFICISLDELDGITMELQMLEHRKEIMKNKDDAKEEIPPSKPLKPFLITRDSVQKKVFGMGYPSLPIMSIEEFYDNRVKEGWFSDKPSNENCCPGNAHGSTQQKTDEDLEEEENIEKLRQRDEWRDDHKRGWGNTYNRS